MVLADRWLSYNQKVAFCFVYLTYCDFGRESQPGLCNQFLRLCLALNWIALAQAPARKAILDSDGFLFTHKKLDGRTCFCATISVV